MKRVGAVQVSVVLVCTLMLWGCSGGSSTPSQVCAPGTTLSCICPGSAEGAQNCNSEGSGYEPCVCGGGSESDTTSSGPDTSTSADTTRSGTDASSPSVPSAYVVIPAGTFTMGSPETEDCRENDETQHQVTLTRSFWLKTTEVTQAEWEALVDNNPSEESPGCADCPVEMVNRYEALAYCNMLSAAEGLPLCYTDCTGTPGDADYSCTGAVLNSGDGTPYGCEGYRLPTEAEWEYAARAGTTTTTYNGNIDVADCDYADASPTLEPIAWYVENSGETTHPVAGKDPNAWGLYDMFGNVREWTWERWGSYSSGSSTDPANGTDWSPVDRGCSWFDSANRCRAAYRGANFSPEDRGGFLGFRTARTLP